MRIRSVSVDGFRGLPDRELRLIDDRSGGAARIVAITGTASTGKTSVLEAIVAAKELLGPYGPAPATSEVVRHDASAAKVRIDWELSGPERDQYGISTPVVPSEAIFGEHVARPEPDAALAALLSSYDPSPASGKVEYFHASRRLPIGSGVDLTKSAGDVLDRLTRLARDDRKYGGLTRFIVEAGLGLDVEAGGAAKPPGRIKQAFEALCGTKRVAGLYRADGMVLPGFVDPTGKVPFGLGELSDSELDVLLIATTFVRAGLVGNTAGCVVLLDTPEKHLGDKDAAGLVRGLHMLGQENQLIVATRAAAVCSIANHVIELR